MAQIKYTSIINSFVSQEGSAGFYTNYIYYSVLVVYTNGKAEIVEGQKSQIAPLLGYLRTPVDELQDIKQLITNLPSGIKSISSNISKIIDEKMSYVLDTICPIPDVRGMKEGEAFKLLEEHNLVPNIIHNDGITDNKGVVRYLQRSRLNYKNVDVGIAHSVPSVEGLIKDVAVEVLEKAGFQAKIKYVLSQEQEQDMVLRYSRENEQTPVVELEVGSMDPDRCKQEQEQQELDTIKEMIRNDQWISSSISPSDRQKLITEIAYALNLISLDRARKKLKQIDLNSGKEVIDYLVSLPDDELKPAAKSILQMLKDEAK